MQCTYCEMVADSEDHVPPRSMYTKGTGDLIKVPCCADCRKKFSKHDELFVTFMVHAAGDSNPVSKERLFGSVSRAMNRLVGIGPKIKQQTVSFDLLTESGIYTGKKLQAIDVSDADWKRIQLVLIRFVRALHFHMSKRTKRLDDGAYLVIDFESEDGRKIRAREKFMSAFRSARTLNLVDGNVCKVKIVEVTGVDARIWLFEFYGRKRFIVIANTMEWARESNKRRQARFVSPSGILLRP